MDEQDFPPPPDGFPTLIDLRNDLESLTASAEEHLDERLKTEPDAVFLQEFEFHLRSIEIVFGENMPTKVKNILDKLRECLKGKEYRDYLQVCFAEDPELACQQLGIIFPK